MLKIFIMMFGSLTCIGAASIILPASPVYLANSIILFVALALFGVYAVVSRKGFSDNTFPSELLYFYGAPLFVVQPVLLNMNKGNYIFLTVMLLFLLEKAFLKGLHFDHGRLKCKTGVLLTSIIIISTATIGICKYQSWLLFGLSSLALLFVASLARRYASRFVICTT